MSSASQLRSPTPNASAIRKSNPSKDATEYAVRDAVVRVGILSALCKVLLLPAGYSTDLEVHRHWKSLTHSLPLSEWYTDESSQWTLDYPPLFAYFERILAAVASRVDPEMLSISAHNYASPACITFLRLSVVATDAVLAYGLHVLLHAMRTAEPVEVETSLDNREKGDPARHLGTVVIGKHTIVALLVLLHPGLVLVDNIHFQYNGFVLGVFLASMGYFVNERLCLGAICFAATIHLKHTFLPTAPLVTVFLLAKIWERGQRSWSEAFRLLVRLALSTLAVFAVSWLPLYHVSGFSGIMSCVSRMFPFGRGLLHAYWAPNAWAVYAAVDKVLAAAGFALRESDVNTAAGHIGSTRLFRCLPNVSPRLCMTLVLGAIVPVLVLALPRCLGHSDGREKNHGFRRTAQLPRLAATCTLLAFMFGWHVHEKMILLAIIPMLATNDGFTVSPLERFATWLLSTAGAFGVMPLVVTPGEALFKLIHFFGYSIVSAGLLVPSLGVQESDRSRSSPSWGPRVAVAYLAGAALVEAYAGTGGIHQALFGTERLAFVPLLAYSLYASFGISSALVCVIVALLKGPAGDPSRGKQGLQAASWSAPTNKPALKRL